MNSLLTRFLGAPRYAAAALGSALGRCWPPSTMTVRAGLVIIGLFAVSIGAACYSPPAGLIVFGAGCIAEAYLEG